MMWRSLSRISAINRSQSGLIARTLSSPFSSKLQRNPIQLDQEDIEVPITSELNNSLAEEKLKEAESLLNIHQQYFHVSSVDGSPYNIRSGSYLPLKPEDTSKYLPEGFAGSIEEDFALCRQKKWMLRDSTKLLFRLLEEIEATLQGAQAKKHDLSKGLDTAIEVKRLTDRSDWSSSHLRYLAFGKEVKPASSSAEMEASGFVVSKGPGSVVEGYVEAIKRAGLPKKLLLNGDRGVGKSVVLNQLVHYARSRGWLCVFVPHGWDMVQMGPYVEPLGDMEGQKLYNNPYMSITALRGLHQAHYVELQKIPLTPGIAEKYTKFIDQFKEKWQRVQLLQPPSKTVPNFLKMREIVYQQEQNHDPSLDKLDAPLLSSLDIHQLSISSLGDLVVLGVALMDTSGLAFIDVINELRKVTRVPVLFAVDGYNYWLDKSAFYYDYERIRGTQLAVPHALSFLDTSKTVTEKYSLANGLCVATTSLHHPQGGQYTFQQQSASVPAILTIPHYNKVEFLSTMSYYLNFAPADMKMTVNDLLAYRTYVGSTGEHARRELVSYATPFIVEQQSEEIDNAIWKGDLEGGEGLDAKGVEEAAEGKAEGGAIEGTEKLVKKGGKKK